MRRRALGRHAGGIYGPSAALRRGGFGTPRETPVRPPSDRSVCGGKTGALHACHSPQGPQGRVRRRPGSRWTWEAGGEAVAVPKTSALLAPLLGLASRVEDLQVAEAIRRLAEELAVAPEDLEDTLPSGGRRFDSRVAWAATYLVKAGLLDRPKRGYVRLTEEGRNLVRGGLPQLDEAYLMRYPGFARWVRSEKGSAGKGSLAVPEQAPEEILDEAYRRVVDALAEELLERVKGASPAAFERLVVRLLQAMGYGGTLSEIAAAVVGRPGDGGIDGIIKQDPLGLDVVYVQAKRWQSTVGHQEVAAFVGSLAGLQAQKGVFVTTSTFSEQARKYVEKIGTKVVLVNGEQLSRLMIRYGIGVTEVARYVVHKVDGDFFEDV